MSEIHFEPSQGPPRIAFIAVVLFKRNFLNALLGERLLKNVYHLSYRRSEIRITYHNNSIKGTSGSYIFFPHSLVKLVKNSFQVEFDFFRGNRSISKNFLEWRCFSDCLFQIIFQEKRRRCSCMSIGNCKYATVEKNFFNDNNIFLLLPPSLNS